MSECVLCGETHPDDRPCSGGCLSCGADGGEWCSPECSSWNHLGAPLRPAPDPRDAALRGLVEAAREVWALHVRDAGIECPPRCTCPWGRIRDALRAAESAMGGR